MLGKVGDGALAGHDRLHVEAEHREHREAAVLDLLDLELSEGVGVVSQAQRVEGAARVERVEPLDAGGLAGEAEGLGLAHERDLHGDGRDDRLRVDQGRVAEVVEPVALEDLGTGREPDRGLVRERHAVVLEDLRHDAAERAEHGPAGVDDLDLAVAGKGLRVGREARGVPSVVAGELAVEVGRRGGERAEVEVAVLSFSTEGGKMSFFFLVKLSLLRARPREGKINFRLTGRGRRTGLPRTWRPSWRRPCRP